MILRKCSLYTCPLFYATICAVLTSQSLLSRQHFCQNNSVLNFLSHIRACEWFILYIHWMFIVTGENVMEHWNSRDFKMNVTVWICNINMTGWISLHANDRNKKKNGCTEISGSSVRRNATPINFLTNSIKTNGLGSHGSECSVCVYVCVWWWCWKWRGQADMTRIISVMESNQISKRNWLLWGSQCRSGVDNKLKFKC